VQGLDSGHRRGVEAVERFRKTEPERIVHSSTCFGFVRGVAKTLQALHLMCPPENATAYQLVRMVIDEIEKPPEMMHEDFVMPATAVLMRTWPCPKN
jgi:hypothetical protein